MIAHLRGILRAHDLSGVVIDCGGVGYGVSMSLQSLTTLPALGEELSLFVYTHVAEDSLRLFGFVTANERRVFEILLGTSGVGPKLALTILGALPPQNLMTAVLAQDKSALTRIPGVGSKKAERLLVELKGRFDPVKNLLAEAGSEQLAATRLPSVREDLQSALDNLGFARVVAERAASAALEALPGCEDLAQLVREALRRSTARPSK